MREKEKENKRREERSVSARAGKHASQPGKQVNEWTNERTNDRRGSDVLPSYTYFPRRCHHRSRLDSSPWSNFTRNQWREKKRNENRRLVLGTCRPCTRKYAFEPNPQIDICATIPTLCYWFCSTIAEYLWTPMIS